MFCLTFSIIKVFPFYVHCLLDRAKLLKPLWNAYFCHIAVYSMSVLRSTVYFFFLKKMHKQSFMKNDFNCSWLLSFPVTEVYFRLLYVFRDENLPSISKFVKISPFIVFSRPPLLSCWKLCTLKVFTFYLYLSFFLFILHFTNKFALPSNPSHPLIVGSSTQENKVWNLY